MEEIKDINWHNKERISALDLTNAVKEAGFQGNALGDAIDLIEKMKKENSTIYLSFTANLISSGLRGIIAELCKKKFVDAIVTTSGAIDHDLIKAYKPYFKGSFEADDIKLHDEGINRLGNIFIPTERYVLLEEKFQPMLKEIYERNKKNEKIEEKAISPSELNKFIGEKIDDENSFLMHCAKNNIPVFCPGITDGAIGLQMHFFKQENSDFIVDVTKDMKDIADLTLNADKTAGIILGGGISKHHVLGVNLLREGLDYAVYVTTATPYDGSLSGAIPQEGKSWGKIKEKANSVTVHADATIALPVIFASLKEKKLI